MHEEMFCEEWNRWAEEVTLDQNSGLSYEDKTKAEDAIRNDINQLLSLPFANSDPYMRVNLHHCIKCQNFSTIEIDLITTEINKKEEFEEKKKIIVLFSF